MKKSELRQMIKEELLKESDYSFDNIRIDVYKDADETGNIGITSGVGDRIDLKISQLPKLISILKKIK